MEAYFQGKKELFDGLAIQKEETEWKSYPILHIDLNIANFTKWTTYGMGAVVLRTQGLSILLNRFFGTLINAAYGIALQMYGAVSFVSTSVINAMNPILMKSEGANDHDRMLRIAEKECKYVVAMMATLFIPLIVELDSLLSIWLKDVPEYAAFFCRCLLACFLIDQCTYGLNSANQAMCMRLVCIAELIELLLSILESAVNDISIEHSFYIIDNAILIERRT